MNALPAKLLALCLGALLPAAALAKSSDRNQPMDLDADSTDCSINDNAPCTFRGNVNIVQGTLNIRAATADVRRSNGEIQTVKLTGAPATMNQELDDGSQFKARASQVDYDVTRETVVLTGNAFVEQPSGNIASDRIVYNMKTGQVQSGGQGGGRVKMRLNPKNSQQQGGG
ncbi:lipopolysaccharide transport periplasmic protein LptA [Vulcaniibacterium tengchongense]|uniref:Lipopolysaccharide export system protein LptA n=1 Tax=Vulcaniibacterium tengchongense TaxID=1273429 RepID=A0A3N4VMI5_9GAMM|nr:lipopolysaccharide transport periplasmic protein LptA [Vulcaniibacterium tengchongense]RPE81019.1 lipopolysaccharide export system protein LptA [Vulcaniibacterium tengchongense]